MVHKKIKPIILHLVSLRYNLSNTYNLFKSTFVLLFLTNIHMYNTGKTV